MKNNHIPKYRNKKYLMNMKPKSRAINKNVQSNVKMDYFEGLEEQYQIDYLIKTPQRGQNNNYLCDWGANERNHMIEFVKGKSNEEVLARKKKAKKKQSQKKKRSRKVKSSDPITHSGPDKKLQSYSTKDTSFQNRGQCPQEYNTLKNFENYSRKLKSQTNHNALNLITSQTKTENQKSSPKMLFKTVSKNHRKKVLTFKDIKSHYQTPQINQILS